jgi:hypothetical protein
MEEGLVDYTTDPLEGRSIFIKECENKTLGVNRDAGGWDTRNTQ